MFFCCVLMKFKTLKFVKNNEKKFFSLNVFCGITSNFEVHQKSQHNMTAI